MSNRINHALTVGYHQAESIITAAIKAGLSPILKGSPGLGKSAVIAGIAKKHRLKIIDMRLTQCDPTDLSGFPTKTDNGRADYLPMAHFPLKGDPLPIDDDSNAMAGWLLFLDEATSAPPAIQAAAYKLVLDRMVGTYDLHPNCALVLAGNQESDGAIVHAMSTALQSRLLHLTLELNVEQWLDWATDKERGNLNHQVTSYIKFKPGQLYTFSPDHTDSTYACPRTWEFLSDILPFLSDTDKRAAASGLVSEGVAREFLIFTQIYDTLVSYETIVANPHGAPVPQEPSVLYALTGTIAHNLKEEQVEGVLKYINRLPAEFQIICLRECVKRNKELTKVPAVRTWMRTNASNFFDGP